VPVRDTYVTVTYDDTYHMYRPPRAHHCRVSNIVVDRFDHFCPWMGTTIGARNYRPFVLFLACASAQVLATVSFCALHVTEHVRRMKREQNESETLAELEGQTANNPSVISTVVDIIATPILFLLVISARPPCCRALAGVGTVQLGCRSA
jgi:DHHC palmitoyltransferase